MEKNIVKSYCLRNRTIIFFKGPDAKPMKKTLFLTTLLLSGCMLGPKKDLPETSFSHSFVEEASALTTEEEIQQRWWEQFNDPILNQLIETTLSKNYDLKLAREKVHEMRAQYRMEGADLWPSVNTFGSAARLRRPLNVLGFPTAPGVSQVSSIFALGFDATWEIDFFGKVRSAKEAAYYDLLSTQENVHNVQVSVIGEVARYYTDIRAHQQRIYALEKKIEAQEKLVELANTLEQTGLSEDIELEKQLAELAQNKSLLPQLIQELKESLYQLTYLLGKQPGELNSLFEKRKPIPIAERKIPIGLPSDLLRQRPDIRSAERDYYASCARIGQAKADLFPSFSLTGALAGVSSRIGNIFTKPAETWVVWPSFNWNIFQGWKTIANIKVQNSKQKQALLTYEQTVLEALKDVESALAMYSEENHTLDELKLQVLSKKRICALNNALLEAGLKQQKELLLAEKDFYDAQDSYFQSKERAMLDLISLYKALGGGWDMEEKYKENNNS